MPKAKEATARAGGVQSIDRAFLILETLADAGGLLSLSQLAERAGLPLATIHRLVRTLVDLGYIRQEESRQYSLGPRLLRLSDLTTRRIKAWGTPHMVEAAEELQESVNLAMLDGDEIVYLAQVQPTRTFMRMFTEEGRRALPHSTAVGKAMLAYDDPERVRALLRRTGMPAHTRFTITTEDGFLDELELTRSRGYATDEGEQEVGVTCIAVAIPGAPRPMAISMSGPTSRVDEAKTAQAVAVLGDAAAHIAEELASPGPRVSA